jgi:hypothetical protein
MRITSLCFQARLNFDMRYISFVEGEVVWTSKTLQN